METKYKWKSQFVAPPEKFKKKTKKTKRERSNPMFFSILWMKGCQRRVTQSRRTGLEVSCHYWL
jgi:hypothetical protein